MSMAGQLSDFQDGFVLNLESRANIATKISILLLLVLGVVFMLLLL